MPPMDQKRSSRIDYRGDFAKSELSEYNRVLVLCIDRDDDVGLKGKMKTPVVGRELCLNAGTNLAITDPEDADSNAIFAAIKTYEDLLSRGYETQVAVVAGRHNRGVQADEKIINEIKLILNTFNAEAAVIVSDGEDDETVIPVIQSFIPVISIQRIIIKHSRSVEYSYALFGRYLKMLAFDPRYSKFFLGVPGALLVVSGIAVTFGLTKEVVALILTILGGAFIIRAFDIDKSFSSMGKPTPTTFIRIFSLFAGILIIIVSFFNGYSSIPDSLLSSDMSNYEFFTNKYVIGSFIKGTITLLWIGLSTILGGILLSNWFKGSIRTFSDILRLVILGLLYYPILQFTSVLLEGTSPFSLISSLLIGLAITLIAATFLFQYYRNKKGEEDLNN